MAAAAAVDVLVGAVLFTDLVGFTEYTDSEGDAAALRVLDRQTELMLSAIGRHDGRIVKELGDGLLVWFAAAHAAVESATSMLRSVEAARGGNGFPVAIRMGLHHGEMLPRGDDLVGTTVNVAARIAAMAGPGELLASEDSIDACDPQPSAEIDPVGPVSVKGVAEPIWIVRVATA